MTAAARRTATRRPARRRRPTRRFETALLAELGDEVLIAGMDEVGRGALAGPVSVGVALVGATTSRLPRGLADSKLLPPPAREKLVAPVRRWCVGSAVGHATPAEIDEYGIIAALRLAGRRALAELADAGLVPSLVILDGNHDWLRGPDQGDLFRPDPPPVVVPSTGLPVPVPPVRTRIKADADCAVVAAASVLAKVERDRLMTGLHPEHPQYCWAGNKGYSSPEHVSALREHGACELHRRSWRLPGLYDDVDPAEFEGEASFEDAELEDAPFGDAELEDAALEGPEGFDDAGSWEGAGDDEAVDEEAGDGRGEPEADDVELDDRRHDTPVLAGFPAEAGALRGMMDQ